MKEKWVPPVEESEDPREYNKREDKPYYDKKHHLERSIANDKRKKGHIKHKKEYLS